MDASIGSSRGEAARVAGRSDAVEKPPAVPQGLVYVSDAEPGFARRLRGKTFFYTTPDGARLNDAGHLDRIRRLAIPPAYTDVWICRRANGHLQATGRDARGRKQYRYHAEWRTARDDDKFGRMREFGHALPRVRARVARELAAPLGARLTRSGVLSTIVRLLDTTLVRVGNEEYARDNKSFGLTTLRNRHVRVSGDVLQLRFRGKSGIQHEAFVDDPRIARVVRRCQALPGQELFQYQDADGQTHGLGSADVNDFLHDASGADFTAKDFRTWHASVHALELFRQRIGAGPLGRRGANEVLAEVASRLGNTVAVCRKSYVHPRVLQVMVDAGPPPDDGAAGPRPARRPRKAGLTASEREFLAFLETAC